MEKVIDYLIHIGFTKKVAEGIVEYWSLSGKLILPDWYKESEGRKKWENEN